MGGIFGKLFGKKTKTNTNTNNKTNKKSTELSSLPDNQTATAIHVGRRSKKIVNKKVGISKKKKK
jgi:hypothetical protein